MDRHTQRNSDTLNVIFDRALSVPKIFKKREAVRADYIPENLPFRTDQIRSVGEILAPILKSSKPSNLLIYGKTGTGKTAVTRYTVSKLEVTCKSNDVPARFVYCNTRMTGTEYRTLAELAAGLGIRIPFTGLATSEVLSRLHTPIKEQALHIVLVLDEIDYLVRSYGDNLLYELTNSADGIAPGFLSIIGISNDLQFKEDLGARVLSRLSEEELVFPPYTVSELRAILKERAKLAFLPDSYNDASINLCAALSGSEHGDARRAVDLLRIAGEVAEREGTNQLEEKHVRVALQKIDQDRIVEALRTLPIHGKLALLSCLEKNDGDGNTTATDSSSSGAIYQKYTQLCKQIGLEALTTRRVSSLLTELDTLGLISATIVNYGRYGRTKKITPHISMETVSTVFADDETLKHFLAARTAYGVNSPSSAAH